MDLLWEQHTYLPLTPNAEVGSLVRYQQPGGAVVSINAGYAPHSYADVLHLLNGYRRSIAADGRLLLAATTADVQRAQEQDRVAIIFDLEDSGPLDGQLDRIDDLYSLGVRTLLPTYNYRNAAGSGCLDPVDEGLTAYGRTLVARMNQVGMVVDGSHCSTRTGLQLSETTSTPMIYSHSCMRSVWDHERNITDEQAIACAQTGGVIGITGVGIFLGPNDASVDALIRHIDYAVELLGPEHVGLATDYPIDQNFDDFVTANPQQFSSSYTRWGSVQFMIPETLRTVGSALLDRGYPLTVVRAITGGNFHRIAQQVWR